MSILTKVICIFSKFADELILPLLWVQDGFSEPSQEMLDLVKFCLAAPHRFSLIWWHFAVWVGIYLVGDSRLYLVEGAGR